MKDKEWLKEELLGLKFSVNEIGKVRLGEVFELVDQLDEPEITEEQAWNKIAESYPADAKSLVVSFEHFYYEGFSKKEVPVIPQFVADWIERNKQPDYDYENKEDALADSIHFALYSLEANYPETNPDVILRRPVNEWLENDRKNYWKLIDGVRYGYEVNKEKFYYIELPTKTGFSYLNYDVDESVHFDDFKGTMFTESEIKAIDERYLIFAKEVTE